MGKFTYDTATRVDFEDRVLLHLQTVISNKLRRHEGFVFTWREDQSMGGGRTSVWLNPSSSLVYRFSGSRLPELNRNWLEALMFTANSPTGLYVISEPVGDTQPTESMHDPA